MLAANQPAALRQVILTYQDAMILPAGNESTGDFPPPKPGPERREMLRQDPPPGRIAIRGGFRRTEAGVWDV
jgi:hypothetical protein